MFVTNVEAAKVRKKAVCTAKRSTNCLRIELILILKSKAKANLLLANTDGLQINYITHLKLL